MPDPAKWLNAEFPDWRHLRTAEKKAIRDFPVLWAIFELWATGQHGQRPDASPPRIISAVEQLRVDADLVVLQPAQRHFADRYFLNGRQTHAFGVLSMNGDYHGNVQAWLTQPNVPPNDVLLGLLLILNRLRNRYLHGEKARDLFHDQFDNFTHANNVLMHAIPLWR